MKEYQIKTNNEASNFVKENGKMIAIVAFAVVSLILILISIFGLKEFVVPVCGLIILEAGMAACLHKVELWKHGVMLIAQIVTGIIIGRVLLVIVCVIAYVAATVALQFMAKSET